MREALPRLGLVLSSAIPSLAQDNVLLIILDDIGVDRVNAYGEHPNAGVTPNMDALAASGVLFRNAWVQPNCSASRASMITGRYPGQHGIGNFLSSADSFGLTASEVTIPEMLTTGGGGAITSFAVGKWHLSGEDDPGEQGMDMPLIQGFAYHAGSARNIDDYFSWKKYVNGVSSFTTQYATTDTTDDAIAAIGFTPEPWFGWVAYNASHVPLHAPPPHLSSSFNLTGDPNDTPVEHMKAMTEAVDTELGRLLASVDPDVLSRTTIVLIGDNGTQSQSIDAPFDPHKSKGTVFEGGVNVPLIVAGPHVSMPGSESAALVSSVDMLAFVGEVFGIDVPAVMGGIDHESVSFLPHVVDPALPSTRAWVFTQAFLPNQPPYLRESFAARDVEGNKLYWLRSLQPPLEDVRWFKLHQDPFEQNNLLFPVAPVPEAVVRLQENMNGLMSSF